LCQRKYSNKKSNKKTHKNKELKINNKNKNKKCKETNNIRKKIGKAETHFYQLESLNSKCKNLLNKEKLFNNYYLNIGSNT